MINLLISSRLVSNWILSSLRSSSSVWMSLVLEGVILNIAPFVIFLVSTSKGQKIRDDYARQQNRRVNITN